MMTELRVHNFRTFRKFTAAGLTRVSLLVGANNAGKTSVLDAAELLLGGKSFTASLSRRGEISFVEGKRADVDGIIYSNVFNVEHLFHGRTLQLGAEFRLEGEARGHRFFSCKVTEIPKGERSSLESPIEQLSVEPLLGLELSGDRLKLDAPLPLDAAGRLSPEMQRLRKTQDGDEGRWVTRFLGTTAPNIQQISTLWNQVVLTPEEERVTSTLQIIEPTIARVAALTNPLGPASGFFVRLQGSEQRIPLGSMGEGIKRLLVLSLNLVNSAGGYLLVDEIDTGLHHSVMVKMWRLVVEAAKRLDVQVLATTHSLDCVHALAELYEQNPELRDDISLHRIERGAEASIRHSADELLAAARHQMEVR